MGNAGRLSTRQINFELPQLRGGGGRREIESENGVGGGSRRAQTCYDARWQEASVSTRLLR